jgi:hypothetical protein
MGEAVLISAVKWPDKAEDQLNCRHSVAKNLSSMTPEMYKDIKSGIRKRKTGCEACAAERRQLPAGCRGVASQLKISARKPPI